MSNIEEVLMRRDGISREEASNRVKYCKSRLANEALPSGDYNLAEDILAEELGLEMDYIYELI